MTPRRPAGVSVHDWQHGLVEKRRLELETASRRQRGLEQERRRRLGQSYWWTLTGHMRGQHAVRGQAPFLTKTMDEVEAWHARLHEEDQ